MHIYYELAKEYTVNGAGKYWKHEISIVNSLYNEVLSRRLTSISERVWSEDNGVICFIRHRYKKDLKVTSADAAEFNRIKLIASDTGAMSMNKYTENVSYIGFPPTATRDVYIIPDGVLEWITSNTTPDWGYINDVIAGVYLTDDDATAFKIKWMM